jgi:hypothetical protein
MSFSGARKQQLRQYANRSGNQQQDSLPKSRRMGGTGRVIRIMAA